MDPDQINELGGDPNAPLAFRMMEHMPGLTASLLFASHRGSNTVMRGGFMDDRRRGPGKLGGFARGSTQLTQPTSSAYYGSSARRTRLAAAAGTSEGKMAFGKGARVNHITARPRALSRYNSLSIFNASNNAATYSPFQFASRLAGSQLKKNKAFRDAFYGGREIPKEEQVLQRGMLSMAIAGRKTDMLEKKALDGSSRAAAKVARAQEQVKRLAAMNNPLTVIPGTTNLQAGAAVRQAIGLNAEVGGRRIIGMSGMTATERLALGRAAAPAVSTNISYKGLGVTGVERGLAGGAQVGLTGNLMASAGANAGSRAFMGYARGALGNIGAGGLTGEALTGAQKAVSHMDTAIQKIGLQGPGYGQRTLSQGAFKTLGVQNTLKAAATKEGAMVLGTRTAMMAIPGLNLLATASLVYDLGKMGGELIKSGANLAKDAVKSMKGSIDKPVFGMGYKDNEISATSRSRGVMAIQNSRLNARSMLGSEGGMMAAHFG
jgi:hypothetical protein